MGNRERRQRKLTHIIVKRIFYTLALLFIVHCSLLIANCGNPFVLGVFDSKTVTFETNGGSHVDAQSVYKGYPIKRPSNPSKLGYLFDDWYIDNFTFQQMWDFYSIPSGDTTLYADWLVDDTSLIGIDGKPVPNNKITVRYGDKSVFSSADNFSNHKWTLNGIEVGAGEIFTFDTSDSDKELGRSYILGLNVRSIKDGRYYSSFITIRIPDADVVIRTQPKLSYNAGDMLDLSGLVVTLNYDDGVREDVAFRNFTSKNLTASPADKIVLSSSEHNNQPINIYYGGKTAKTNPLSVQKIEQQTAEDAIIISWDGDAGQIRIETSEGPLVNNIIIIHSGQTVHFYTYNDSSLSNHYWTLNGVETGYTFNNYFFDSNNKEPGKDYVVGLRVEKDSQYYFIQITVRIEQ